MKPRVRAYVVSLVFAGLVVSPLLGAFADDSFPISTYPMFASIRSTDVAVQHVVLVDQDGEAWPAPASAVANEAVLQVQQTVRQALRQGDEATAALCERVADRVADTEAVTVQIMTSYYDALRYYDGHREPRDRTLHHECEVP